MKSKWALRIQRFIGSLCISAAVLAIANVEAVWQEYRHSDAVENLQQTSKDGKMAKKKTTLALDENIPAGFKPLQSALSRSFEQDELMDQNPFAHLSSSDPLQQIMTKGVTKFHREVYRSPEYQGESGYDLVSYEIEHTDGSKSTVLAYLDRADPNMWRNVGAPDERIPFIIFMVSSGEGATYSFFRAGHLVEQSALTSTQARDIVAQRLSLGIPFLSVSR